MNTKSIIVFDVEPLEIITNKSDLELFYDELKKSHKMPSHKYDIFYQMDMSALKKQIITSTVSNIALESILDYFIPHISNIPDSITNKKKESHDVELSKQSKNVSIKLKEPKECIYKDIHINVAKHSSISIKGLLYTDYLSRNYLEYFMLDPISRYFLKPQFTFKVFKTNGYNAIDFDDTKREIDLLRSAIIQTDSVYNSHIEFQIKYNNSLLSDAYQYIYPSYKISKDNTKLGKILQIYISYDNEFNNMLAYNNIGYYSEYNKLLFPDSIVKEIINQLKYAVHSKELEKLHAYNKSQKQMEIFQKRRIAYAKFGLHDLYRLSKQQLEIVNKEYVVKNSKPLNENDKIIAFKFHEAIDSENEEEMKNLLEQAEKIQKSNNNLLICQHTISKVKLLLKNYKDIFEKSQTIQHALVSEYGTNVKDGVFCKICGELLIEIAEEDMENMTDYSASTDYDNLYVVISREISYILSTYVKFINIAAFNLRDIVKNITNTIKGKIREVESNVIKVKTAQKENIKITVELYIYVYAFAAICQLIYANSESISFKKEFIKGGKSLESPLVEKHSDKSFKSPFIQNSVDRVFGNASDQMHNKENINTKLRSLANNKENKADLQKIINDALYIIRTIKAVQIRKSEFVSHDGIKNALLTAYRWVLGKKYVSIKHSSLNYWIQNDVINYFLWGNYYINGDRKVLYENIKHEENRYISSSQTFLVNNFPENKPLMKSIHNVLGRNYDQIQKELSSNGIFGTLKQPKTWDNKYKSDSLQMIYEYMANKLYKEFPKNSKVLQEYYDKYVYLKNIEKKKFGKYKPRLLQPFSKVKYVENITVDNPGCVCEEFELFYTKDGKKEKITVKDVQDWLNNKEYDKVKSFYKASKKDGLDRKCSKCRTKEGKKINSLIVFYGFFEQRCPKGNLHEFMKNKCEKCGITNDIIVNRDESYYNKYKDVYDKIKKTEKNLLNALFTETKKKKVTEVATFPKYLVDFSSLTELNKIIKINENDFYNLGMFEHNKYEVIKQGKLNIKDMSDADAIKRNNSLFSYYIDIIRAYYTLKNSEASSTFPKELKNFLNEHSNKGVSKFENFDEANIEKCEYYKKNLSAKDFSMFLLQLLSSTLMMIYNQFIVIKKKEMGAEFIKLLYTNLLEAEKKLTVFMVKKTKLSFSIEDTEEEEDSNSKDILANEAEIDDEPVADQFSIDNMDVDLELDEDGDNDNLFVDINDK